MQDIFGQWVDFPHFTSFLLLLLLNLKFKVFSFTTSFDTFQTKEYRWNNNKNACTHIQLLWIVCIVLRTPPFGIDTQQLIEHVVMHHIPEIRIDTICVFVVSIIARAHKWSHNFSLLYTNSKSLFPQN